MRITKNEIPVKIDVPGAVARQLTGFGDASDYGTIAAEYFTLGAGTDIAPLLEGLNDDACHFLRCLAREQISTQASCNSLQER